MILYVARLKFAVLKLYFIVVLH